MPSYKHGGLDEWEIQRRDNLPAWNPGSIFFGDIGTPKRKTKSKKKGVFSFLNIF